MASRLDVTELERLDRHWTLSKMHFGHCVKWTMKSVRNTIYQWPGLLFWHPQSVPTTTQVPDTDSLI